MDIAIATDRTAPNLDSDNALLLDELIARGLKAEAVVWDDSEFDWSSTRICVIRATWDYMLRREEFLAWADRVGSATLLRNDVATLRWNSHKRYLKDLDQRGVTIVPTLFVERGTPLQLGEVMQERGWSRLVVKPAVSASGRNTFLVTADDRAARQAEFDRLVEGEDVLVQPFMSGVTEVGEVSIVYVDGVYSHSVRRRPAPGDFRVQSEYGGTIERVRPRTAELLGADRVLEAGPARPLSARIDILTDGAGELRLNEYELVEPRLHLRLCREAAARLADAICSLVEGGRQEQAARGAESAL